LKNNFLSKPNYIRIYGHRGARGEYPENTIEGFKHTFSLQIKAIEFDVLISKDNVPTIYHNFTLNKDLTKDGKNNWLPTDDIKIYEKTFEEIKTYNVGGIDSNSKYGKTFSKQKTIETARIPSLKDLLEFVKSSGKDIFLNLEIKSTPYKQDLIPNPSEMVKLILKDINDYSLVDQTLISSFDWRILKEVKKQNSNILRGYLSLQQGQSKTIFEDSLWVDGKFSSLELFELPKVIKSLDGHVWCPFYRDVTKENVKLAHDLGLAVNVWTLNNDEDVLRMIEYSVDGIITDYPKKVKEICKKNNISWF
jgi:glycerophosphoryl diester phosphodiesterase